ncbi:MAG TPA: hypothetical protein VFF89_09010 [Sphingobium sp.]|nr:hypothetical protein [Sphingobium sp.]
MAEQTDRSPRREALQRVQIGLIGLGAVLLVVAFANIVATVRPDNNSGSPALVVAPGQPETMPAQANGMGRSSSESEPLADLGVAPAPVSPSVPDLEPDPRLRKPMDQDPKAPRRDAEPAGAQR